MGILQRLRGYWWAIIPLGWVLVGSLHNHAAVTVMVLVTIFIGAGGFGLLGRGCSKQQDHDGRGEDRLQTGTAQPHGSPVEGPDRPVDLTKTPASPRPTLAGLGSDDRLPADLRERAQRLDRECVSTLSYLREHGAPTSRVFEVEQIQTDFGPQAVRSYLALAPGSQDTVEILDGKNGHQLVVEQLDLLLEQVAGQLHSAARYGTDQLLANHRFLREKFGDQGRSDLMI